MSGGNYVVHGTLDVDDISDEVTTNKTYTYYGNGDLETKTEVLSSGVTRQTTYVWDANGNPTSSDEIYI